MHIVIVSPTPVSATDQQLGADQHHISRIQADTLSGLDTVAARQPDVMIAVGFAADQRLSGALAAFIKAAPGCAVIPVLPDPPASVLLQLMQLGVREVLPDASAEQISAALGRLAAADTTVRCAASAERDGKRGRCIGLVSAKGGDGGSCMVANLAAALGRYADLRVIALDMSLPFGDLEMFLTPEPSRHDLADLCGEIERLDGALLQSMAQHLGGQLRLIPSPSSFDRFVHLSANDVSRLLDVAVRNHDLVLVDLGAGLDPVALGVLEQIDQMVVVATLTLPSVRRAGLLLRVWEGFGYSMGRASVVINRTGSRADLDVDQFAQAVRVPILRQIPDEPDGVKESLLVGRATVEIEPHSAFSRVMRDWAAECAGRPIEERSLWHLLGIR